MSSTVTASRRLRATFSLLPLMLGTFASAAPGRVEPYVPTPHGGAWAIVKSATEEVHRADIQSPAARWSFVEGRGRLPRGWADLSAEKGVGVRYSRLIDDGLPLAQWIVSEVSEQTPSRIAIPVGMVAEGGVLRVVITLRSPTKTPAKIALLGESDAAAEQTSPLDPGTGWTTREFNWRVERALADARLVLAVERPGTIEISELFVQVNDDARLDRVDADGVRRPLEKNLLRATRFPLGLPPRWMIDRRVSDGDEVAIAADAAQPGPSGSPSLHVKPNAAVRLFGEPFAVLRPSARHVASFAVRGPGSVRLEVYAGDVRLAAEDFGVAGESWRRIALPFQPRGLGDELYFEIKVDGEVWIDAVRVAAGEDATDYVVGWPVEVALAAERPSRIIFDDEPASSPVVRWRVVGETPAGATLRGKVVSLYGEQIELPPVSLDGGSTEGRWALPTFPGLYGSFRYEVWVESADGKRASAYEEIVVNRVPRPRRWGRDAPDSPFGVHVLSANRHLEIAKSIGVNWVRTHDAGISYVGWYFLEKEKGRWTFADEAIRRYRRHNLMILGQLGTAPAWATALQRVGPSSWTDRYYQPEDMDGFRNYVRVLTERYRDEIRHWDIWNEPWLAGFWKKDLRRDEQGRVQRIMGDDPAGDFARLQQAAYEETKRVDPALQIVGFNSTGGNHAIPGSKIAGEEWTRMLRDAGSTRTSDIFSYHQYVYENPGYTGDTLESGYRIATRPLLDAQGRPPMPVWLTEGNAVQKMTNLGFYHQSLPFPQADNDRETADRLCRYVVTALGAGAEKVFLYSMHKLGRHGDNGFPYRVLLTEDGQLHPTAVAYAALTWRLEGKRFREAFDVTPDTRAYVFADASGWTAVLAPRPGQASTVGPGLLRDPRAADIYGNSFRDGHGPVRELFYLTGEGAFDASALAGPKS